MTTDIISRRFLAAIVLVLLWLAIGWMSASVHGTWVLIPLLFFWHHQIQTPRVPSLEEELADILRGGAPNE